jgi:RNA polymerase sigma-70 factor (ECF subfamily)
VIEAPTGADPGGAPVGPHAWRQLRSKLRPFVARRVSLDADVDDVVQEVLLRIQRGLPGLRDEQRFGPWVYRVARHAIIDHARARARHAPWPGDAPTPPEDLATPPADTTDDDAVAREVARYTALFVAWLPSPYREALTLTELEGLTQREAALMLGISLSGMKSRVQRGRLKLRMALEDCCHIGLDARRRVIACEPRSDGKLPAGCCAPALEDGLDSDSSEA